MSQKRVKVVFYRTESGNEPVREWLLALSDKDRKIIGDDLQTLEFGWPIGMPVCRAITSRKGVIGSTKPVNRRPHCAGAVLYCR